MGLMPEVWAMVVEAWCSENKVEGRRYISRLYVLPLFDGTPVGVGLSLISKHQVPISEVHCRYNAQLEVAVKAQFARYAHHKTWVVAVLVGGNVGLDYLSVV